MWPEWCAAWFLRLPGWTHKQKVTALIAYQHIQDEIYIRHLVNEVKKFCI